MSEGISIIYVFKKMRLDCRRDGAGFWSRMLIRVKDKRIAFYSEIVFFFFLYRINSLLQKILFAKNIKILTYLNLLESPKKL